MRFALLVSAGACILGVLHAYFMTPPINADSIYVYMLVSDLARHPPIVAWWLPPANGLFPDVIVSALGFAAGLRGFGDTVFLHAFFCGWTLLTAYAFLRAGSISPLSAITAVFSGVAALDFLYRSKTLLTYILMVPDSHEGMIGIELACAALYLRFTSRREGWTVATLIALIAVGVFSDRIVVTQFAIPIALLALLRFAFRRGAAEAVSIFAIGAGTLAGLACVHALNSSGAFQSLETNDMLAAFGHYGFGQPQLRDLLGHLASVSGVIHGVLFAIAYLALLALAASARQYRRHAILILAAAFMSTGSLLTPILSQTWIDNTMIRYLLPVLFIPAVVVAGVAFNELEVRRPALTGRAFPVLMLLAGIASVALNAPGLANLPKAQAQVAADVSPLVAGLSNEGSDVILAQYWIAKPLLYTSGYGLKVCEITDDGGIREWIADVGWCVDADRAMRSGSQTVAIVDFDDFLSASGLQQRYGPALRIGRIAGYRVFYFRARAIEPKLRQALCTVVPALRARTPPAQNFGCS